jgi:hypothetical protein
VVPYYAAHPKARQARHIDLLQAVTCALDEQKYMVGHRWSLRYHIDVLAFADEESEAIVVDALFSGIPEDGGATSYTAKLRRLS